MSGVDGQTFFGKKIEVILPNLPNKPSFNNWSPRGYGFNITGTINFNDAGDVEKNTITINNLSPDHQKMFKEKEHIVVKAGSDDLFAVVSEGKITKVHKLVDEGATKTLNIEFSDDTDYGDKKKISVWSGAKTVKKRVKKPNGKYTIVKKTVRKKINLTFKKGTKASTIVKKISKMAGIPISNIKFINDYVYKKGYTVSNKPLVAIKAIVKQCKAHIYFRKGKLYIDNWDKPNPYNENLTISKLTGLVGHPSFDDDDRISFQMYLDPRISTGSVVRLVDKAVGIDDLYRVKSGSHDLESMITNVEVYK